jgi:hypothetical protein
MFVHQGTTPMDLYGLLRRYFTLCVDDVLIPQETHGSSTCYGDSFTLYVDDVRTSQEAHASTAC